MNASIKKVEPKKRGRPATGKDPLVGVRLPPDMISTIEALAKVLKIPRSEAIRRLIQAGIIAEGIVDEAGVDTQRVPSITEEMPR